MKHAEILDELRDEFKGSLLADSKLVDVLPGGRGCCVVCGRLGAVQLRLIAAALLTGDITEHTVCANRRACAEEVAFKISAVEDDFVPRGRYNTTASEKGARHA